MAVASIDWVKVGLNLGAVTGALLSGAIVNVIVMSLLKRLAPHSRSYLEASVVLHCAGPLRLMLPLLALDIVIPSLAIPSVLSDPIRHMMGLLLIFGVGWLMVRMALVVEDVVTEKFRIDVKNNVRARQIRTQFAVFRRVFNVIVVIITFGIALTTFDWVRTLGNSLLASAGIVGLAASLAARPTVENLVAGLQIALTEPFRIDDVVIAEGEWGWIEEISTTYVVVRTWDLRRLILPISYFISNPFQNWKRQSTDILGYVYLNLDYRMPIEPLRQELTRIVDASPLWDRKTTVLQVTDATEHTIQVRALASAADSSRAWDLKCEVREKLIDFIQRQYPQYLPRSRAELDGKLEAHVFAPQALPEQEIAASNSSDGTI